MTDLERYNRDKATVISMIKFILLVLIVGVLLFIGTKLVAVLVPFIIGFLLAKTSFALAEPLAKKISKPSKYKEYRRKISTVIYIILLVIIALVIIWCCTMLVEQGLRAINTLSKLVTGFDAPGFTTEFLNRFTKENGGFITPSMMETIQENFQNVFEMVLQKVPGFITSIFTGIWSMIENLPYGIFVVICIILSGYYFINDGPNVLKAYLKRVPNKSFRMKSVSLLNDLSVTLFRALGGYVALLVITAVEAWIAFKLAGVNYAVILALVTAVIDFLPVLGISATMIPVMCYLGLHHNFTGVIILVIAMAIMTVLRRVLEPAILGKSLHLHPLMMLLGMALGVYIWGAIGFLLGPTMLIIILDVCKVFEIDKKVMNFLSRVLSNFMKKPEEPVEEPSKAE